MNQEAPTDSTIAAMLTVALAVTGGILLLLWRRGWLSRRAFENAPPRHGRMGLLDLAAGFLILIVGQSIVMSVAERWTSAGGEGSPAVILMQMLFSQAGMLPVVLYVLFRAATATEGGIGRGLGLSPDRPGRLARWIVLSALAVIPVTFGASIIVTSIATLMGYQPPMIAHELLRVLAETPSSTLRWGLILGAVLLAPLLEECLFRGLLQTSLLQCGLLPGRWTVILIASVPFTLVHISPLLVQEEEASPASKPAIAQVDSADMNAPLKEEGRKSRAEEKRPRRFAWHALPVLFVLSVGLGVAYEASGRLWVPIGIHALFNAVQIGLALTIVSAEGEAAAFVGLLSPA